MAKIEILDASPGDESGIILLLKETWLATYPNKKYNITREDILKKNWESKERLDKWRKVIADNGKNSVFNFVAKEGNEVVGFCQFVKEKNYNELKIIYVLSEYQGKGIGKMLANKTMSLFDRNKDTIVEVVEYSKGTIGFYKKLGFVEFEKGKGHKVPNGKIMPTIKMKLENDKIKEKKKYCVIVNGIVVRDNKILLAQRSFGEGHVPGGWSPPGGKLEEIGIVWNALEETVKREVLEEVGVEVEDEMHLLINNTFEHAEDDLLVLSNVFLCKYKRGEPKPLEDTIAVRWVGEDEINNYEFTHDNVKNYIIEAFKYLKSHPW